MQKTRRFLPAALFVFLWGGAAEALLAAPEIAKPVTPTEMTGSPEGVNLLNTWKQAEYRFTPEVKNQWLRYAKSSAQRELAAAGKSLPKDFLEWVDGDPLVQATVYGARENPANVLMMLRSLELDLGKEVVRRDYTQYALAAAVVHADQGPQADLTPRKLLNVVVPGDPRKPVNTKDAGRILDRNDHIINFLGSNKITEDVVIGQKEEPAPLKYDAKGIAIPPPKNAKPIKVPVIEKRTRTLYAADVMASRELQEKFNAYMKEHGENVAIDCGEKVISWKSTAGVGPQRKNIADAFVLFRTAYEAKGLLPMKRDASPTPAESAAWLIRNDKFRFPEELAKARNWPRYPLNAPWPTLTLLAADTQPLREREERWTAFRDKGEIRSYGEYTGGIAQQSEMQSARRLTPFAFHYNTYQMMAKDGGVCGTMANMGARTNETLGIPSCTAGQPGHCALIAFSHNSKTSLYDCVGGQFATAGPSGTSPHTPWIFAGVKANRPMIYYQTIAWAVNYNFQAYLDSTLAYRMFRGLREADSRTNGGKLLESGLALNPYNILLTDAAQDLAATAEDQCRFWKTFTAAVTAIDKPGCPKDGLYNLTVRTKLFANVAKLPVPADKEAARALLTFLRDEKCTVAKVLIAYQVALDGVESVALQTQAAFKQHLASVRTDAESQLMAAALTAVADSISDKKLREQWTLARWQEIQGHENYLGPKNKITTDASAVILAKITKNKLRPDTELIQPLLGEVAGELRAGVEGNRQPKECANLAAKIATISSQIKEPEQSRKWLMELSATMAGREEFISKDGKKQRDPCAATIAKLLAPPATVKS